MKESDVLRTADKKIGKIGITCETNYENLRESILNANYIFAWFVINNMRYVYTIWVNKNEKLIF